MYNPPQTRPSPYIIHQTWKTKQLEGKYLYNSQSWQQMHPQFEYRLYDDDDLRQQVAETYPQHLEFYKRMTTPIERVDLARYVILARYGGVYCDMDTVPLHSFAPLCDKGRVLLAVEPREHQLYQYDKLVCNAIIVSPQGSEFWKRVIEYCVATYEPHGDPMVNTGPQLLARFINAHPEWKDRIQLLPCHTFYSVVNRDTGNSTTIVDDLGRSKRLDNLCEDCIDKQEELYAYHEWDNTWVKSIWADPRWNNKRYQSCALAVLLLLLVLVLVVAVFLV